MVKAEQRRRDVVLFLGAGFSADAGLPTMAQFGVESRRNTLPWSDDPRYHDALSVLAPAKKAFEEFQAWCRGGQPVAQVALDNMEEVFCLIEALGEAGLNTIKLPGHDTLTSVGWIADRIALWLWKVYQQCPPATEQKGLLAEPYDALIDAIGKHKLADAFAIVTTNYDLVFEYFARKSGMTCSYPIQRGCDWVDLPLDGSASSSLPGPGKGIPVCKLHGSVNYFTVRDPAAKGRLGIHDEWVKDRPALFNIRTIGKLWRRYNEPIPAIIPPTYAKLRGYAWLRKIWRSAFKLLRDARALVFIGYSMPESDGFMRAMIQGAMAARTSSEPPAIWVVDCSAETHARYTKLFPQLKGSDRLVQKSFADAVSVGDFARIFEEIA